MRDEEKLQVLWDERLITRRLLKFGHSLDTKNWIAHTDCFTDPVNIDFSRFMKFAEVRVSAALWSRFAAFILSNAPCHHMLSAPDITIEGHDARATVQMISSLWTETEQGFTPHRQYGWYEVWLERRGDEWKISRLKHDFRGVDGKAAALVNHDPAFAKLVQDVFSPANIAAAQTYLTGSMGRTPPLTQSTESK